MNDDEIKRLAGAFDRRAEQQRAWVDAKMQEIAPTLADVPERIDRFLLSVRMMLAASNGYEAAQYAQEVAREAEIVALLNVEYKRALERLAALAPPMPLTISVTR